MAGKIKHKLHRGTWTDGYSTCISLSSKDLRIHTSVAHLPDLSMLRDVYEHLSVAYNDLIINYDLEDKYELIELKN